MTTPGIPDPRAATEATVEHIRALNERIIESAKAAGQASLDAYEKALQSLVDFEQKAAKASQLEWVTAVASAHAKFVQDVSAAYVTAAREALK